MRFQYVGGKVLKPIAPSLVQTVGSFHYNSRSGRVAVALYHNYQLYTKVMDVQKPQNSYEVEWCAVYSGLLFALRYNVVSINIENDNLGLVKNLLTGKINPKDKPYVNDYKKAILDLAKQTQWTGIRWIPREQNRADDLFR
jgi:ribonuclease HI